MGRRRRRMALIRRTFALALSLAVLVVAPTPGGLAVAAVALLVACWPSSAGRWAAGAAGERRTARALEGAEAAGWAVLHDVRLPGRRWNIDHLLVGTPGVLVVETKQWRTPVRTLRRHPRILVERVGWQVEAVAGLVPAGVPVHGFLCVHGARVRRLRRSAPVGDGRHLRRWMRRLPPAIPKREIAGVVRTFE